MNNYRVDLVAKCESPRVPCGMNSLIYLGTRPPAPDLISHHIPYLKPDQMLCLAEWSDAKRDYIVLSTISNPSN